MPIIFVFLFTRNVSENKTTKYTNVERVLLYYEIEIKFSNNVLEKYT